MRHSHRMVTANLEAMSQELPPCPQCGSTYTYEMEPLLVCPECAYEWQVAEPENDQEVEAVVKDAVGNILQDGDTVTIIRDLKVKGSSTSIKVGTKVRNIRLISATDGHDIDAKVDGFGSMYLKSSIVKKVL
jgi:protein PhnA